MNRSDRFAWVELTARWLPEIERIEQACFTAPWSRAGLESDLLSPTSRWYGAADRQTGRLAAFLGVHICLDEAEIVNVATHPDYRRLGLAEELLREFLRLHPALSQIFLEVRESNTAARMPPEKNTQRKTQKDSANGTVGGIGVLFLIFYDANAAAAVVKSTS